MLTGRQIRKTSVTSPKSVLDGGVVKDVGALVGEQAILHLATLVNAAAVEDGVVAIAQSIADGTMDEYHAL